MRTISDVERFLADRALKYQDFGGGMFVVNDDGSGIKNLAIKVSDEVVVFQLRVLDAPEAGSKSREALFERLLRLNGEGLLHAAFALLKDGIYLQAALPLANLDPNEMQAVLDDMGMAVSQHLPQLTSTSHAN
jgi:CesT_Tir_1